MEVGTLPNGFSENRGNYLSAKRTIHLGGGFIVQVVNENSEGRVVVTELRNALFIMRGEGRMDSQYLPLY